MLPTVSPASRCFFAPMYCPSNTVPPVATPQMKLVTSCMTWPELLTAVTPAASENWPTTIMSTTP